MKKLPPDGMSHRGEVGRGLEPLLTCASFRAPTPDSILTAPSPAHGDNGGVGEPSPDPGDPGGVYGYGAESEYDWEWESFSDDGQSAVKEPESVRSSAGLHLEGDWPQSTVLEFAALHYSQGLTADAVKRVSYSPFPPSQAIDVGNPFGFSITLFVKFNSKVCAPAGAVGCVSPCLQSGRRLLKSWTLMRKDAPGVSG